MWRRPLRSAAARVGRCFSSSPSADEKLKLATALQQHWKVNHSAKSPVPGLAADHGIALPIVPSSAFKFTDAAHGARLIAKKPSPDTDSDGYVYSRWGNPSMHAVGGLVSRAEGIDVDREGSCTYVFTSGMAAISSACMSVLKEGAHVVAQKRVYGGTHELLTGLLPDLGVEVTWVDGCDMAEWRAAVRPNTRLLYAETPANPTMRLIDLEALGALSLELRAARRAEDALFVAVDGTFGTPYHQTPLEYPGIDMCIHSCTKYMGGHSDLLAGCVTSRGEDLLRRLGRMQRLLGNSLNAWESFLLARGMRTLVPRMRMHSENAQRVAEFLEGHPRVKVVNYPGLPTHPDHELAKRQMRNGFGGMVSFELPDYESAGEMCGRLKRVHLAVSLGATESLISHPASTTHSMVPEEERRKAGVPGGLVRLSVGIEDVDDLISDLKQALDF